jgi:hypothetical protein
LSPTRATIYWTPGQNGTKQQLFVSTKELETKNSCPAGSSCVVKKTDLLTSTNQYTTGDVLSPGTVYTWRVVNYKNDSCDPASLVKSISSCSLNPKPLVINYGSSVTLSNDIFKDSDGVIKQVDYVAETWREDVANCNPSWPRSLCESNGCIYTGKCISRVIRVPLPSAVSFDPNSVPSGSTVTAIDSNFPYSVQVKAVRYYDDPRVKIRITSRVYFKNINNPVCSDFVDVSILLPRPWWRVINADVTSSRISSVVPNDGYFELSLGGQGFDVPGIPFYSASADFGGGRVSETGWIVKDVIPSSYSSYNYGYFFSRVPAEVRNGWNNLRNPSSVTGEVNISSLSYFDDNNSYSLDGYRWVLIKKNQLGRASLTIDGAISVPSSVRYVFLVDGDLNINQNISVNANGFVMFAVSGNININPNVTTISGVYFTNQQLSTGTLGVMKDSSLNATGSFVAINKLNLERNLTDNLNPAETFTFSPSLILQIPYGFWQRNFNWREVNPGR